MVTIMVLVGGTMGLSLVLACAFGRAAAQADMAREAAFARYLYEAEHGHCQELDDAVPVRVSTLHVNPDRVDHLTVLT